MLSRIFNRNMGIFGFKNDPKQRVNDRKGAYLEATGVCNILHGRYCDTKTTYSKPRTPYECKHDAGRNGVELDINPLKQSTLESHSVKTSSQVNSEAGPDQNDL